MPERVESGVSRNRDALHDTDNDHHDDHFDESESAYSSPVRYVSIGHRHDNLDLGATRLAYGRARTFTVSQRRPSILS